MSDWSVFLFLWGEGNPRLNARREFLFLFLRFLSKGSRDFFVCNYNNNFVINFCNLIEGLERKKVSKVKQAPEKKIQTRTLISFRRGYCCASQRNNLKQKGSSLLIQITAVRGKKKVIEGDIKQRWNAMFNILFSFFFFAFILGTKKIFCG